MACLCLQRVLLWAMEMVLKYIERNGYYLTALHNRGYVWGCNGAYATMMANEEDIAGAYDWPEIVLT
jgi:Plasma-membrane choline transporter